LSQPVGSGQRWMRIEDVGNGKEMAERVRCGKASLRIVQSPWGVEFYICDTVEDTCRTGPRVEILVPSAKMLSEPTYAGAVGKENQAHTAPAGTGSGLVAGRSFFAVLTVLCAASNLIAFLVSSGLPRMYIELDRLVQPGSLFSLIRTEDSILIGSLVLLALVRNVVERSILQGLILGVLAADAVNDFVLVSTGSWLLAMELALTTAVLIPVLVGIVLSRGLVGPPREKIDRTAS